MPQEEDFLNQKALLFPFVGNDDNGQPLVSATPTEINVRWEGSRREVTGPQGTPVRLSALVTLDREVTIGSIMWLGGLRDVPGTGDPIPTSNLHQVISYEAVPDIKEEESYKEAGLARWNDTALPTA